MIEQGDPDRRAESSSPTFGSAVLIAALTLVALSGYTHFQNVKLRQRVADLVKAREYPQLLTGLKLDILATSTVLERWPHDSRENFPAGRRKLLLVTSDKCAFCKENSHNWLKLVASIERHTSSEVWLLTMDTTNLTIPLVSELKKRDIPFRLLSVDDPLLFTMKTGILGTPTTLLLEGDATVGLICSGQLGAREIQIFRDYLNRGVAPRTVFLTSSDRRMNEITASSQ
jgi:hypothetical protein